MWYSFIDGRVLLMFIVIGALWVNYWASDEYLQRKQEKQQREHDKRRGV